MKEWVPQDPVPQDRLLPEVCYGCWGGEVCDSGGAKPGTASLSTVPSGSKVLWWPQDLCWHPD